MDLDYSKIDDEVRGIEKGSNEMAIKAIRNEYLFQDGAFQDRKLVCLAFLLSKFESRSLRREEFWLLVNPDLDDKIKAGRVKEIFLIFVELTILMRLGNYLNCELIDIEKERDEKKKRKNVIDYLNKINKLDLDKVILNDMIGAQSDDDEFSKDELLTLIQLEHLNAVGFRMHLIG